MTKQMAVFGNVMMAMSIEDDTEENKAKKAEYRDKMSELVSRETPAYVRILPAWTNHLDWASFQRDYSPNSRIRDWVWIPARTVLVY